jgi:hypothetical protein
MANSDDVATRFVMGGGATAASFKKAGDTVTGVIGDMVERQQTSYESGEPLTWPDGKPRTHLVVTLVTEEAADEDDDGLRRLYVKGNLQRAIRDAVIKSGSKTISDGGLLTVTYTGDDTPARKGMNGAKLFSASYESGRVIPEPTD